MAERPDDEFTLARYLSMLGVPDYQPAPPPGWQQLLGQGLMGAQVSPYAKPGEQFVGGLLRGFGGGLVQRSQQGDEQRRLANARNLQATEQFMRAQAQRATRETPKEAAAKETATTLARLGAEKPTKEAERAAGTVSAPGGPVGRDTPLGQWILAGKDPKDFKPASDFGMLERFHATHEPVPGQTGRFRPVGAAPQAAMQLRTQIKTDPDISDFVVVRDNYERVKAGAKSKTGIGDLAVIFAYMKVLDPTSVVRETEYKNASEAIGKIPLLSATPKRWLQGDKLTPEGRAGFLREIEALYRAKLTSHQRAVSYYEEIARDLGIDPKLVLRDYTAPSAPTASGARPKTFIPDPK